MLAQSLEVATTCAQIQETYAGSAVQPPFGVFESTTTTHGLKQSQHEHDDRHTQGRWLLPIAVAPCVRERRTKTTTGDGATMRVYKSHGCCCCEIRSTKQNEGFAVSRIPVSIWVQATRVGRPSPVGETQVIKSVLSQHSKQETKSLLMALSHDFIVSTCHTCSHLSADVAQWLRRRRYASPAL